MDGLVAFVATVDALAVECAGETAQTDSVNTGYSALAVGTSTV